MQRWCCSRLGWRITPSPLQTSWTAAMGTFSTTDYTGLPRVPALPTPASRYRAFNHANLELHFMVCYSMG